MMATMPEGHEQLIKIPDDRAQCFEEGNAKHHDKTIQWNGVALNGEEF